MSEGPFPSGSCPLHGTNRRTIAGNLSNLTEDGCVEQTQPDNSPKEYYRLMDHPHIRDLFCRGSAFWHAGTTETVFTYLKKHLQAVLATHRTQLLDHRITRPDACLEIQSGTVQALSDRTKRVLREGNNLEKLYLAGEFGGNYPVRQTQNPRRAPHPTGIRSQGGETL